MIDVGTLRLQVRDWLSRAEIPPHGPGTDDRFHALLEWQRALNEAGWLGLHWPRRLGGRGMTPVHHLAFCEELARSGAPPPIGLIGLDVVGPSILRFGTQAQCKHFIPPLLSADHIWCQGFSEPDAGSDLASLQTEAKIGDNGFIVNGQKVWTSWAHKADWCALLVSTTRGARQRGISYLLVDMQSSGISVSPLVQMTGDSDFAQIYFEDVVVPRSNLLGELNEGWQIAMHTLATERSFLGVRKHLECKLIFNRLLELLRATDLAQSNADHTFETVGSIYIRLKVLEAQMHSIMERVGKNGAPSAEDSMDKLLLTSVEQDMFSAILDLLGAGRMARGGEFLGAPSNQWIHGYLASRSASIYGGTSQIQRNIVAERYLGLPKGN